MDQEKQKSAASRKSKIICVRCKKSKKQVNGSDQCWKCQKKTILSGGDELLPASAHLEKIHCFECGIVMVKRTSNICGLCQKKHMVQMRRDSSEMSPRDFEAKYRRLNNTD